MANNKIQLQIVTPEKIFFDDAVDMAVIQSTEGVLGVLYDHEPLVTTMDIGLLRIIQEDGEKKAAIHGGFAEIQPQRISILTDSAEWPEEIDVNRAKAAKERAEERLTQQHQADVNMTRAKTALRKALLRLEVSNQDE